jgi:hypothetical protein
VRLYVGWLASRLGWRLGGADRAHVGERDVLLHVTAEKGSPRGAGSILGVSIAGTIDGAPARVHVERGTGSHGFSWTIERAGRAAIEHGFRLTARDELWLLTHAIDASEPDRVLRAAIEAAAGWRG